MRLGVVRRDGDVGRRPEISGRDAPTREENRSSATAGEAAESDEPRAEQQQAHVLRERRLRDRGGDLREDPGRRGSGHGHHRERKRQECVTEPPVYVPFPAAVRGVSTAEIARAGPSERPSEFLRKSQILAILTCDGTASRHRRRLLSTLSTRLRPLKVPPTAHSGSGFALAGNHSGSGFALRLRSGRPACISRPFGTFPDPLPSTGSGPGRAQGDGGPQVKSRKSKLNSQSGVGSRESTVEIESPPTGSKRLSTFDR